MAFEQRSTRRQRVRYNDANDDNPLVLPFVIDGAKVAPTSATITIYKPGVSTALVSAAAMTKSGTLLTYALDASASTSDYSVGNGYRAECSVTYNSITYPRHFIFDVVRFVLVINVTDDQLVELDSNLDGMHHAGDEDFSQVINAAKDLVQAKLEAKVVKEKKLLQDMILDYSGIELAIRYRALGQIWHNHKDFETRDYYLGEFDKLLASVLSSMRFDDNQDGEESGEIGGIQEVRLVT